MATIARPTPRREDARALSVLWVNEHARFTGGAERYVHDTARLLAAEGVRSSLLYGVEGWTDPAFLAPFAGAWPVVDLARQLREIQPDVVYVHRASGAATIDAVASGPAPALRFFHDHRPFCLREHKYRTLGKTTCTRPLGGSCYACLGFVNRSERWPGVALRGRRALERELDASRRLAGVVVGSRYMAGHVMAHGFAPGRVHVLPLYAQEPGPAPHVRRDPARLLFVGQLVTGKGLDVLLEAMSLLPVTIRLDVAGAGCKERELRALAERLGLGERVRFLGARPAAEIESLCASAWAVVAPSRSPETFGLVGPESMRLGTPVVATRVGGTGEWLEDGATGLAVPPNDARALAIAILRLHEPGLARGLGRKARERYLERFRPQHHVRPLAALLREVAG